MVSSSAEYDNTNEQVILREAQLVMLNMLRELDKICVKNDIKYWLDGGTLLGAVRHEGFIPWDDDIDIGMLRADYNKFLILAVKELPKNIFVQTKDSDIGFINLISPVKLRDDNSLILEGFEDGKEPYQQGLFVDIFPYDYLPTTKIKRTLYKYLGKKISKFQRYKIEKHRAHSSTLIYTVLDYFVSMKYLDTVLEKLIVKTNKENNIIIGFGLESTLKRVYEVKSFFPLKKIKFENSTFLSPMDHDYYLSETYGEYLQWPPLEDQIPKHTKVLIPDLKVHNEK